ncbi:MAG TPA: 50S ribosomal protein L25/general stress protein Ctc [Rhodanobacteraceae bacterium]|jgi:large subunit ribosomal protein L25|nr:50S ribosomal protein L25/general stress protein Ctc [Rhodanobacteraceae bacterium]
MATIHEITAEPRADQGKGASRRLRRAGKVPAVVYGADTAAENIQFDHETLALTARNDWFASSILDLLVGDKRQKVLLRDLQKHPVKPQLLHLDFLRIDEAKPIRVYVSIRFLNKETSPAAKTSGVVISHNLTEVEVSCLPKDLPEYIELDLAGLDLGDILHLSDLKLPAGVEIPELKLGKEYDHTVVSAQMVREEVEEVPEVVEGEAAAGEGAVAPAAGDAAAAAKAPAADGDKQPPEKK